MSLSDKQNLENDKSNDNNIKNTIIKPLEKNKESPKIKDYNYKEINSPKLDKEKFLNKNIDISSPIYPISISEDYPYYFKYNDSTRGDEFHKTKKLYPSYNRDNKVIQYLNENKKINNYINKPMNDKETSEKNCKFNNWYAKFKSSKFFDEENKLELNRNIIDNNSNLNNNMNIYNNKNDSIRKNNIRDNEYFLNNEMNKISLLFKQINSHNISKEPCLIKNKYEELF